MTAARGHTHSEAFCLMQYQADDGSEIEMIWNSRDGVTPFVITLRSGKQARHVNWGQDVYAPDHKPQPGDRIFTDLTPERARRSAARMVDAHPEYLPADTTREEMIDRLAAEYATPGAPDLVEVAG